MREVYIDKETGKLVRTIDNGAYVWSFIFGFIYFLVKKCYLVAFMIFLFSITTVYTNNTVYVLLSILCSVFSKYIIKKSWEEQGFYLYNPKTEEENNAEKNIEVTENN